MRYLSIFVLSFIFTLTCVHFSCGADNINTEVAQEKAIAEIIKIGGKIERDDTLPGKPVISVTILPEKRGESLTEESLAYLGNFKQLQRLGIGFFGKANPGLTDKDMIYLKDLTNLRYLCLRITRISSSGLVNLRDMKNIETLIISDSNISGIGLQNIKYMAKLNTLELSSCDLIDEDMEYIKELNNLETLIISHNIKLTDKGIDKLIGLKKLKKLNLFGIYTITDHGLESIGKITSLESLILQKDIKYTQNGLDMLQETLPKLKISVYQFGGM
jgi:internalin A